MSLSLGSAASRFKVADGNLGLLQEYLRRDPDSYKDEFLEQFNHFLQFVKLLELEPKLHRSTVDQLLEVVNFLTAVAFCYSEQSKIFASKLIELLSTKAEDLGHELRLSFSRALIALRNAKRMTTMEILPIIFQLVQCEDKSLRIFIKTSVLSIIKHTKIGSKKRNKKKRRHLGLATSSATISPFAESSKIQAFVFTKIQDSHPTCARIAQWILMQAYRKGFWRDAKTANTLAECCFHTVQCIQISSMRFFLGSENDNENEDSDSEAETRQDSTAVLRGVVSSLKYRKKTKKREKDLERAKKEVSKSNKSKKESRSKFCNYEALSALYDPQKFADRLFGYLESKKNEKFALRLLQIALCARVIGIHCLQTLGFYSYIQRYLQPKQREVTRILLYAAQTCHELVPPDLVENLVRRIAQNFVSDQNTPEAITVGLNAIREIFSTCPAAATEELLRDLTEYKSYKNKNVSMAARALITLFRSVNPKLLHQKDRGRPAYTEGSTLTMNVGASLEFGALNAVEFVPGAEVLSEDEPVSLPSTDGRKKKRKRQDEEENSDDEWVNVLSSDDNIDETSDDNDDKNDESDDNKTNTEEDENSDTDEENEEEDSDNDGWVTDSEESNQEDEEIDSDGEADEQSDENDNEKAEQKIKKKVTFRLSKMAKKKAKAIEKEGANRQALEKAKLVSESRILTDADFRAIRINQIRRKMNAGKRLDKCKRKRTNDEVLLDEEIQEKFARMESGRDNGLARLNDIEHFHKKIRRQSKAERLAHAEVDKDERKEFRKPKKTGSHVGRTNREISKRKSYQMVKQKARGKNRQRSFRDRQISLRNYLLRQAGKKV